MGKGSTPRPFSVTKDEYNNNFDRIFRNKVNEKPEIDKKESAENDKEPTDLDEGFETNLD